MTKTTEIDLMPVGSDNLDIRPISGWVDEWEEGIREEKNRISLKFPLFDHEMKGKLRGKLCVILHYGGTKKSLLAQNIVHSNKDNGVRSIYSSMEMGVAELINRFVDIEVAHDKGNASYHLELEHRNNAKVVREIYTDIVGPAYGDLLQISQNSGLTCDEYRVMVDKVTDTAGQVDILVVDGLSMMGGKGTELELANMHTRGLKELAKDRNIFVICIVHASRGGDKHTRDVSKHARGSEKIIDNCDFYICPSLIEDGEGYRKDCGYLRLVNKRGTGNQVDLIYSFDPYRLLMTQTTHDPRDYDRLVGKADIF